MAGERREQSCRARYAGAYHHGVSTQQRAGAVTVTAGAAVLLVGTFLTWLRSGATERSSYDVFDLVDRLGFSEGGLMGWALRLWPLVPLLLVLTVIAWWFPASGSAWTATTALTLVALSMPVPSPSPSSTHRTSRCSASALGRS